MGECATLFRRLPLVPSMVSLDHLRLCLTTCLDPLGQLEDLEAQDMATVAQDMVLHMGKEHLQLLAMAHLKLLSMVNLKLLFMANSRDRHNLVNNSSNNLLLRVSSNLQHNSQQLLSDSTGMADELCWKKCIVPW